MKVVDLMGKVLQVCTFKNIITVISKLFPNLCRLYTVDIAVYSSAWIYIFAVIEDELYYWWACCRTESLIVLMSWFWSFLSNWWDYCLFNNCLFSRLRITVDLPLSAGKITIDVSDCNYFKALRSFFKRLSCVRPILARIMSASSFSIAFQGFFQAFFTTGKRY